MRATVVLLVSVLALYLGAPAAHAERWAAQDQRGDVTATTYDVQPAPTDDPCADVPTERARSDRERDLRRLTVEHTREAVTVTMTMRAVRPRSTATSWYLRVDTNRKDYEVSVSRYERGAALRVSMTEAADYPQPGEVEGCYFGYAAYVIPCASSADADPASDRVTLTIPRVCLKRPRWVQVGASAQTNAAPDAAGLLTILSDFWGSRGSSYEAFVPPLSPRVRP